jgi:hypothetical protein
MSAIGWFWHIVNFIAPALWLGLGMTAWDRLANRKATRSGSAPRRWRPGLLLDGGIGIAVLLGGLAITGHDGRMVTYGVLVLAVSARRWLIPGS